MQFVFNFYIYFDFFGEIHVRLSRMGGSKLVSEDLSPRDQKTPASYKSNASNGDEIELIEIEISSSVSRKWEKFTFYSFDVESVDELWGGW